MQLNGFWLNYGLTVLLLGLAVNAVASEARPSNKWRLEFSGGADSNGAIELRITPLGGAPIDASIEVSDGTGENAVAKTVVKGLKALLPKEAFHVERDDGEDVLIKRRRGAAEFLVEVTSNTVEGVRIDAERE